MGADIDRLRRDVSLSETARRFGVSLEKDGREWIACCPFHEERTPSFTVFRGKDGVERFNCFGCAAKGDVIDFVRKLKLCDVGEACRILGGSSSGPNAAPRAAAPPHDPYAGIEPLDPPAELEPGRVALWNPKRGTMGGFIPALIHTYRRADGSLIGYVLRHDLPDGGKETPQVMWCRRPGAEPGWCRYPFPRPRPLYGLSALGAIRQVIVVEGEKTRDALAGATGRAVVTWPGGTNGVAHADWTPLVGLDVIVWPDADDPGWNAAKEVAARVTALGCRVRLMAVQ
jgi:hypothetical protein